MGTEQQVQTTVAEALTSEQAALATVLHDVTPDQWTAPSLCPAWTIQEVVTHLAFHIHRDGFRETFGSTAKQQAILVERAQADTPARLVAWFESPVPTAAAASPVNLAELVIHGQDVRRALAVGHTFPDALLDQCLDRCTSVSGNLFVVGRGRRLGHGLRLVATDTGWAKGSGPVVTGPAEALLMAVAGRAAAVDDLRGPGVEALARRLGTDSTG